MIWPEVGGKATDLCSVGASAPDTVPLYSMITKYSPAVDPLNSLSLKNNILGSPVLSCWKQWAKETKIFVHAIHAGLQSATKWVETLRPKLGFFTFYWLQKEAIYLFIPHPLHAMLYRCSSYLQKTANTPTSNGGGRGRVQILLFSEDTLFEYKCLDNFVADCSYAIKPP